VGVKGITRKKGEAMKENYKEYVCDKCGRCVRVPDIPEGERRVLRGWVGVSDLTQEMPLPSLHFCCTECLVNKFLKQVKRKAE